MTAATSIDLSADRRAARSVTSPGRSAVIRSAVLLPLVAGLLVTGFSGLGCRKKGDEATPAPVAETAAPAADKAAKGKAGKQASGKSGDATVAPGKGETGKAAAAKADAGPAGTKKGKKGAPAPPAPVVLENVPVSSLSDDQLTAQVDALRRENARLSADAAALVPQEPYILINTTLNRLSLKKGDEYILKDAVVSTGSNTELVDPKGARRWFFSTPKGVHTVKKKMTAPIWVKPDWAFVEEGEPVPGAQAEERFEAGTLGRYSLYFGNGYMIHGTLFQRFLGQSVTHGCVRVGDADLEVAFQNASVGTKIYIY